MRRNCLSICIIAVFVSCAHADIIYLRDGQSIQGIIKHADDGWTVSNNGKTSHVSADQVESIELTPSTAPTVAADRLCSLRRSVENVNDLPEIINRFQRFVDTSTDVAVTTDAKQDLATWQERQRQKMVKVAGNWVTPADRQKLLDQSGTSTEQARQLIKQGRTKDAQPLLSDAISVDPQNVSALYLQGLLQFQREQIFLARKSLDAVVAIVPNHAPSLNNLAIVQWRQHQFIPAMTHFDAAMLALPVNKLVLDNVASALLALPPQLQDSPVVSKVNLHFQQQDQQLSAQLAQTGLHRYGAIWVSDHDMDAMRQQETLTQTQLDLLSGEFDISKLKIDQLDQNAREVRAQIQQIQNTSTTADPITGQLTQLQYPSQFYDLIRDEKQIQQQRDMQVAKLDAYKKQAQDLEQNRPGMKFNGVLRMFGPEGTPLEVGPATQPTESK